MDDLPLASEILTGHTMRLVGGVVVWPGVTGTRPPSTTRKPGKNDKYSQRKASSYQFLPFSPESDSERAQCETTGVVPSIPEIKLRTIVV